jgi:hypothetical protein
MYNIFDDYTAAQLREMFLENRNSWPDNFLHWVHDQMASDLLDQWLDVATEEEYLEKAKDIVEDMTYGYEDENGNEMLDFE